MREKKGYLARRGRCVTGLSTSLAVLRWRPVAVSSSAVVPTTAPSGTTVSLGAATFFSIPCCSFVFSRSLAVSSFPSSQCWVFGVSLLCFGWLSLLFSLFGFFLSSGSLPLFLCFSFFFLSSVSSSFPRCLSQHSWVLFIEPRAWLFTVLMGSSWLVCHWARLPRFGSPRFSGRCVVGGWLVCSVGGLQAREGPAKFKQKPHFSFFPAAMFGGKKKEEQCHSKRHRSALSFFFW